MADDKFIFGRYLRKYWLDYLHIAHTHALGGADVPFGGYDLWPIFYLWFQGDYWL